MSLTYARAKKTPKGGWACASPDNMRAARAQSLERMCCINAKVVYDWATKHDIDLALVWADIHRETITALDFVGLVLDGIPYTPKGTKP